MHGHTPSVQPVNSAINHSGADTRTAPVKDPPKSTITDIDELTARLSDMTLVLLSRAVNISNSQ